MICKKCGAQLEDNSKFCGFCGTTIEEVPATDIFNMGAPVQPAEPAQPATPAPMPEAQPVNIEPIAPMPEAQPVNVEPIEPIQPVQPEIPPVSVEPIEPMQPEIPRVNVEPVQPTPQVVEPIQPINMNNGIVPPVETPSYSNDEPEEKKKSSLPIILIILILLGVGGFFAYKYFFNKPDKVVKGLVNKAYDKFETPLKKYDSKDSVLINSEFSMNTNIEGLEDLNGMRFNLITGMDYKNNKFEMGLAYLEDNNKILEALMYVLDKNAYAVLKDIYSDPIKLNTEEIDFEEITTQTTVSPEDMEYIIKRLKDIFLESLDMNDFKQSSDKITLNGSETKVKKISYTLTSEKLAKISNNMIDYILKDEELLNKLSEMTEFDIETLKEELKSSKTDMSDIDTSEDSETVKFDIYTKGVTDEFVGMDIEAPDNTTIQVRKNNDNTTINANLNGASIQLTIKSESKEKTTIDIKINVLTEEITGKAIIEEKEIDSKTTESKITFNMNYQEQEVGFTLNMKQQIGANIADIDVSNAKAMEELTGEEMTQIEQKIMEKLMNSKLYNLINGTMENLLEEMEQKSMYNDDLDYYNSAL